VKECVQEEEIKEECVQEEEIKEEWQSEEEWDGVADLGDGVRYNSVMREENGVQ